MIKGLTIEAEAPQDEAEGMTIITMVMAQAIPIFPEGEVDPFQDGHGGRVVINQGEGATLHRLEQETWSTGAYRSIDMFAVYAETKATMTTSATPYNTWLMHYKANKHRAITL